MHEIPLMTARKIDFCFRILTPAVVECCCPPPVTAFHTIDYANKKKWLKSIANTSDEYLNGALNERLWRLRDEPVACATAHNIAICRQTDK